MPATYEPIATTTLSSATNELTISNIPGTYTDLKLIFTLIPNDNSALELRLNGQTTVVCSITSLYGNGTTAGSTRFSNRTYIGLDDQGFQSGKIGFYEVDIFSYAGSTFKTVLSRVSNDANGSGQVERIVGLWSSTSAITSVTLRVSAGTNVLGIGSTATLFGILKA